MRATKSQYMRNKKNFRKKRKKKMLNAKKKVMIILCFFNQNKELTYAELSLVIPKQKAIYTSATLGRPRNKDVRVNEPTIYAQVSI